MRVSERRLFWTGFRGGPQSGRDLEPLVVLFRAGIVALVFNISLFGVELIISSADNVAYGFAAGLWDLLYGWG